MRAVYEEPNIQIAIINDVSIITTSSNGLQNGGEYTEVDGSVNWGDLK